MNNLNISPDKMDSLLKAASQKLGKDPDDLKAQLEQGNLNNIIGGLDPSLQNKITSLANNPKAVESMLQNPGVANLLSNLMGKK